MNNIKIKIIFVLILLTGAVPVYATDYYVEAGADIAANDVVENSAAWVAAQSQSEPTTVATAMVYAAADDTVYFRAGTYYSGYPVDYDGWWGPTNSGTEGHQITFMAYPGETVILDATAYNAAKSPPQRMGGRALGSNSQSYITWDGFTMIADGGERVAALIVSGHNGSTISAGCVLKNMIFSGGTHIITGADDDAMGGINLEQIRLEDATHTIISNNIFNGPAVIDDEHNYTILKTYRGEYTTISNNNFIGTEVDGAETYGLYFKQDADNSTVTNNLFKNLYEAVSLSMLVGTDNNDITIDNNVFINISFGAVGVYRPDVETSGNDNFTITNNTFVNATRSIGYGPTESGLGVVIKGNIMYEGGQTLTGQVWGEIAEMDYNLYFGDFYNRVDYYGTPREYITFSTWQASTEVDGGTAPDVNGKWADPLFVNTSGNLDQLADLTLDAGSPAIGAMSDNSDMGADVSLVGADITPPTTVTCYPDLDAGGGDLYPGAGSEQVETCTTGWHEASYFTAMTTDCDDTDAAINPGAADDTCDGIDQDCSGSDNCSSTHVGCTGGTVSASGGTVSVTAR